MAIGTWQVTEAFDTSNSNIKYRIACLENSTSTSNNSSNVRITVNIWRTNQGYTTYGTGTSYVTINGTQYTQAITSDQKITYNDYNSNYFDKTLDIPHGTDGKKTLSVSAYISHERFSSSSHSGSFAMTDIPRQTSITKFTVDKYSNTKLKVNWQTADSVKKVEYSTDNGSTFKQGWANDNGATSGNFVISQLSANTNALSPNTPYKCVIRVTRKDSGLTTSSSAVSQTTYKTPTTAISSKTETSITMSWSIDSAASYIQYSIDNGSWVNVGTTTATSGTYPINNLSANSQHSIKTHIIRAASNEYETTNTVSDTTYDWPHVTAVGSSTLTIGNSQTLTLHNPLKRNVTVKMFKDNTSGTQFYSGTTTGTSITFTPNSTTMLNSIPSSQNGKCVYNVYYTTNKTTSQYTYQINTGTIKPTFPNFAYKDVGTSALTTAIANNQVIVQGVSNVNLVISSANKLVPSTGASAATSSNSKYVATFDNLSKTQAYSDSDIDVNLGVPTGKGIKTFSVNAYDVRNTYNTVSKSIEIKEYSQPVVTPSIERLNGFETSTTFNVTGTFSKVTVDNVDKNMISSVKYRYKESSSSTWGSWEPMTIQSQGNGEYTISPITLDCDNEKQFDFQFEVTDLAKTVVVSRTLSVGVPLMFLHSDTGDLDVQRNIKAGGNINEKNYYCTANGNNVHNYPYHRFATITVGTGTYRDIDGVFEIRACYNSNYYGRIKISLRTNGSGQSVDVAARWLERYGFGATDITVAKWGTTGQNVYADVYLYLPYTWPRCRITQIDSTKTWNLINSNEATDTTTTDKKGSYEVYKDISTAATELRGQAYTGTSNSYDVYPTACHVENSTGDVYHYAKRTDTGVEVAFGVGSGGTNHGIYSMKQSKWLIYGDASSTYVPGTVNTEKIYASKGGYDMIELNRTGGAYAAAVVFRNTNGRLGGVGQTGTANGRLMRWSADFNTSYEVIDRSIVTNKTTKTYTDVNTNIPTNNTLAYWNGAYNSSNNSNLTYAHQGIIQCKPTSLYENTSGITGNVTLSQTAANFSFVTVTFFDSHNRYSTMSLWSPNGKTILLNSPSPFAKSQTVMADVGARKFNGTAFNLADDEYGTWNSWNNSWTRNNNIKIIKVIGWKL